LAAAQWRQRQQAAVDLGAAAAAATAAGARATAASFEAMRIAVGAVWEAGGCALCVLFGKHRCALCALLEAHQAQRSQFKTIHEDAFHNATQMGWGRWPNLPSTQMKEQALQKGHGLQLPGLSLNVLRMSDSLYAVESPLALKFNNS